MLRILALVAVLGIASSAHAVLIDFTGGTVYQFGGGTAVTDTTTNYGDVDYYEEAGVRFDFIGPSGTPLSYNVGDYYNAGTDVIHGHWDAGGIGDMLSIHVEKIDGTPFDLEYFKVTSNTDNPGIGDPIGTIEVYVNALADGSTISASVLIPPDAWGYAGPNSEIYLGPDFDNILAFSFTYGSGGVGLGLDEFEVNLLPVPEPATISLILPALGMFAWKRRKHA